MEKVPRLVAMQGSIAEYDRWTGFTRQEASQELKGSNEE
jgi:hypothetical protein